MYEDLKRLRDYLHASGHKKKADMVSYISDVNEIESQIKMLISEGNSPEEAILLFLGEDTDNMHSDEE